MKIAIASDHAAFELKSQVLEYFKQQELDFYDFGTYSCDSCDYPNFAYAASQKVASGDFEFGVLLCGSGQGMQMTANKLTNIRAALCQSVEMAVITRKHNNANVLAMGSRFTDFETAIEIFEAFINTEFEGGRHQKRVDLIKDLVENK